MAFNYQDIKRKAAIFIIPLLSVLLLTGCGSGTSQTVNEDALSFSGESDQWQAKLIQGYSREFFEDEEGLYYEEDDSCQHLWVKYKGKNPEDVKNEVEVKLKQGAGSFGCTDEINENGYIHVNSTNHASDRGQVLKLNLQWNNQEQTIELIPAPEKETGPSPLVLVDRYLQAIKNGDLRQVYECTNYLQLPWDYWKVRETENIPSKFNFIERYYMGGVTYPYTSEDGNTVFCEVPVHFWGKDGRTFEAAADLLKVNGQWILENFTATDCSVPNSLRVAFYKKGPFPMVINCSPGAVRFIETDFRIKSETSESRGYSISGGPPEVMEKLTPTSISKETYSIAEMREALKDIEITAEWSIDEKKFGPVFFTYDDIVDIHEFYAEPIYGW